ncbi:MAG: tetratricopeptide repeat protein [Cyclobacteriaceae bacterium]
MSVYKDASTKKPLGKRQLLVFKVVAILLPLLGLVLAEVALRLTGYGYDLRLFVEDPRHDGFFVMNEHASKKYFTEEENATIGNFERFEQIKAPNTFRIFVLGESTTIGYPYMHNGSFHRWLQYRLMHTFPDKDFEVVNLSLTAVNSYTVQDFARQIVPYAPDAVLMYVGHNEYYGALGVGSTSYLGSTPSLIRAAIALKDFRLFQLLSNLMAQMKKVIFNNTDQTDLRENLMKRMASKQQIPYASEPFNNGIHQFKSNLYVALNALEQAQIPVFISNLVSNEKDLKPFISDTTATQNSANAHFNMAQKAYKQKDFAQARQHYQEAKELDMLRFRAPEAITNIIHKAADAFPNTTLVDSRALFEGHSPHGILGHETLLEHVHPNLLGYALLSEAFYQSLKEQPILKGQVAHEITFDALYRQMPITLVDSLKGAYEIMMLKEGWPFYEPIAEEVTVHESFESELAGGLSVKQISWSDAMKQLYNHYIEEKNPEAALKVAEALLLENPYDPTFYRQAGKLSMGLEELSRAVFYLKKSFDLHPDFETARNLFITLLKSDQPKEALQYLNFAVANNPADVSLTQLQNFVRQIIALKDLHEKNSTDATIANQIAAAYLKFANTSAAAIYIEKSLELAHNNPTALALQAQVEDIKN